MKGLVIFCAGVVVAVVSEVFWNGESRWLTVLWGGAGMLLLRRVVLRFPFADRALLCVLGAVLLVALRVSLLILQALPRRVREGGSPWLTVDIPTFSYGLFRFLLIAPAYTIIEYLEACFRI